MASISSQRLKSVWHFLSLNLSHPQRGKWSMWLLAGCKYRDVKSNSKYGYTKSLINMELLLRGTLVPFILFYRLVGLSGFYHISKLAFWLFYIDDLYISNILLAAQKRVASDAKWFEVKMILWSYKKEVNPGTGSKEYLQRHNAHTVSSSKQFGQRTAESRTVCVHTADHTDTESILSPSTLTP